MNAKLRNIAASRPKPRKKLRQHFNCNTSKIETDEFLQLETEPTEVEASKQCRRSVRKKIVKFDVCNLLKKNRKQEKIQIGPTLSITAENECLVGTFDKQATTIDRLSIEIPTAAVQEDQQNVSRSFTKIPCKRGRPCKQPRVLLEDVVLSEIGKAAVARYCNNSSLDINSANSSTINFLGQDVVSIARTCSKPKTKLRVFIKRMTMPLSVRCDDAAETLLAVEEEEKQLEKNNELKEDENKLKEEKQLEWDEKVQLHDGEVEQQEKEMLVGPLRDYVESNVEQSKTKLKPETDTVTKTEMTVNANQDCNTAQQKHKETLEATQIPTENSIKKEQQSMQTQVEEMEQQLLKRRSKRNSNNNCNSNKLTLEETFAQIAAKSAQSMQKTETHQHTSNNNKNNDLSMANYDNSNKKKMPDQLNNSGEDTRNLTETATALIALTKQKIEAEKQQETDREEALEQLHLPAELLELPATAAPWNSGMLAADDVSTEVVKEILRMSPAKISSSALINEAETTTTDVSLALHAKENLETLALEMKVSIPATNESSTLVAKDKPKSPPTSAFQTPVAKKRLKMPTTDESPTLSAKQKLTISAIDESLTLALEEYPKMPAADESLTLAARDHESLTTAVALTQDVKENLEMSTTDESLPAAAQEKLEMLTTDESLTLVKKEKLTWSATDESLPAVDQEKLEMSTTDKTSTLVHKEKLTLPATDDSLTPTEAEKLKTTEELLVADSAATDDAVEVEKSKEKAKKVENKSTAPAIGLHIKTSKLKRHKAQQRKLKTAGDKNSQDKTKHKPEANVGLPTPTADLDAEELVKFLKEGSEQPTSNEMAQWLVANMETPATTPTNSPQQNPTVADDSPLNESNSMGGPVRRSHRIKQKKPTLTTVKLSESSEAAPAMSMAEQLAQLAQMDAVNEQFMHQEGLNTFQMLRDNYYRCARQVSEENAEMQCDCEDALLDHQCCGNGCINRLLMIECGPLCSNGKRCTNKRFQLHQCWPCRVFRTDKKGCGINAEIPIPPGEFIMEYVGEVIDNEEFERRQHLYSLDRKPHYYFMALRGEAIIDATSKGNISRYINHSCDPNAETQKWTVNGELRIGFFSLKHIQPGEEITFDYQYQRYGRDAQRCFCEASNCRGWIGGEPDAEADEGEQLIGEVDGLEQEEEEEESADSLEEEPKLPKAKLLSRSSSSKLRTKPTKTSRKSRNKAKEREYKAGRWLRPSVDVATKRQEEDPDVLEQLSLLRRSGLKNQADTLRFSRCMVRAKLLPNRLQLLQLLARGELPCRRLFLDYHGLRLLHAWIGDAQLRLALLEALDALPIPNRTMLNDSRVLQSVQSWSNSEADGDGVSDSARRQQQQLLLKWSALPEVFRIPKRERIEQMKEHERAADEHATTALADSHSNIAGACATFSSDPYRQDRFRRDNNQQLTTNSNRFDKPSRQSPRPNNSEIEGNSANSNVAKSDPRRRCELPNNSRTMSKELRRSLFERKVAQYEEKKRGTSDERREHEMRCEFFGADLSTEPKQLPFYQNTESKQWFNSQDEAIATPNRVGNASNNSNSSDEDVSSTTATTRSYVGGYKLPPDVEPLPLSWTWSTDDDGSIYYYHLRDRVPQWEPPNAEQRKQNLVEDVEMSTATENQMLNGSDALVVVDAKLVCSMNKQQMAEYIDAKTQERRQLRHERLVSVRIISPLPEEERVINQQLARKYKENKEIIRRRKESYQRNHNVITNTSSIPVYLYSSDEESSDVNCQLPFSSNGLMKLPTTEQQQLNVESSGSSKAIPLGAISKLPMPPLPLQCQDPVDSLLSMKRKLPPDSHKKHSDHEKKRREPLNSTASGREECEKFRCIISSLVADYLRPYRKESCQLGRITSADDYKFLTNRLSHHITTKEMRSCDSNGNPMLCTESVKYKSYEFIKQYMRKKGRIYERPENEID